MESERNRNLSFVCSTNGFVSCCMLIRWVGGGGPYAGSGQTALVRLELSGARCLGAVILSRHHECSDSLWESLVHLEYFLKNLNRINRSKNYKLKKNRVYLSVVPKDRVGVQDIGKQTETQ